MPSVWKPKGSKRRIYMMEYKDQFGIMHQVSSGCIDKDIARSLAHAIERDAERIRNGRLPLEPSVTGKFLGLTEQERLRSEINDVLESYLADLERRGKRPATIRHRRLKNRHTFKECRWQCLANINGDDFRHYLTRLSQDRRSSATCNAYRDCLNAFLTWCIEQGWLQSNPIAKVRRSEGKDRPCQRRACTPEELQKLLDAAPRHRDRYLVAALTGLRGKELRLIEKRDFDLAAGIWTCRAEVDKTGRTWRLPILPDLLRELARILRQLPEPTSRLFPDRIGNSMFDSHLKRAGLMKVSADGRRLNFHSLRYFFCTLLAKNMPIQNVQRLMRHGDIRRTVNVYLDLGLDDLAQSLAKMPSLFVPSACPSADNRNDAKS